MGKTTWGIIVGVVVLLLAGSILYSQYVTKQANEGVVIEPHVKGNPDAAVVLVEYSDFQCPACKQFYPYVEDIIETYGDSIRFEYRHFPLKTIHPHAVEAARASEAAAQQDAFWPMYARMFENQSTWANSTNPRGHFIQYAEEIGLDVDTFTRHLGSSVIANAVENDFEDAREQGFGSTPTFLLNGEEMTYNTFEEFREEIEAALGVNTATATVTAAATSTTVEARN